MLADINSWLNDVPWYYTFATGVGSAGVGYRLVVWALKSKSRWDTESSQTHRDHGQSSNVNVNINNPTGTVIVGSDPSDRPRSGNTVAGRDAKFLLERLGVNVESEDSNQTED